MEGTCTTHPDIFWCPRSTLAALQRRGAQAATSDTPLRPVKQIQMRVKRSLQMDTEGFEPSTSRMRNGRSSTELSALAEVPRRVSPGTTMLLILLKGGYLAQW